MAFAVCAIGGFVAIGAEFVANDKAERVSKEIGVHGGEVVFKNFFGVEAVLFVEAFFERIEHGVDGDFALLVALHGVNVDFLEEKKHDENSDENNADDEF